MPREESPASAGTLSLLGIEHRRHGRIAAAISEYEQAIANYPKTDRFHLNEAWNNLGTAFLEAGNYERAKAAWETAVTLMPSDETSVRNLLEFICGDRRLPAALREPSALVRQVLKRRGYL